jgi:maleate isomerase
MQAFRSESVDLEFTFENITPKGRVGLMALATDLNIEDDLRRLLPASVKMFTSRIANSNPITIASLRNTARNIIRTAHTILPDEGVDILIYGCTSGAIILGNEKIAELIAHADPRARCINPADSAETALNALSARRISILTPYERPVNDQIARHFVRRGFEVLNIAGFDLTTDFRMSCVPPDTIAQAALNTCHPDADALFISCTSLRAAIVINQLEAALGRPVVTSNQALAWHVRQLLRIDKSAMDVDRLSAAFLPSRDNSIIMERISTLA